MNSERLSRLLASRERETLEFKKAEHHIPDSLYETICAFLNHRGGDILLGVDDTGQVTGIDKETAERYCVDIANATNNGTLFSPPFLLYPQMVEYEGTWLVVVQVPESSQVHKLKGLVYDRSADGDYRVTDPTAIARIVNKKRTFYSEAKVYPFISEKDLNSETLKKARTRLSTVRPNHPWLELEDTTFLKKAGLICRDMETGQEGITLAGVLLFGLEETILNILPFYKIDALLKRVNVDRYDDRCYVQTNLIEAYSTLMDFIERSLPDPFYLEKDIRVSLRNKIFRELVANLLVHREYTRADVARIVIYQDRIEFTNPCTPHWQGRLDPQSLVPYQRNPLISKFFLQLGWVEEIGSGLLNVQRYLPYYASQGRLEVYEEDLFRVVIVLEATPQATLQATPQATPQAEGDRITQILKYCVIPRSREEIQTFLGLKDREYVRKEILDPLISAGKLELTIPDKPHSPKQKYQTRGVVS